MNETKIKPKATKKNAAKTNLKKASLVKVVVLEDKGKWIKPNKESTHYINEDAVFPSIVFEIETENSGPYEWTWKVKWDAKVSELKESSKRGKLLKTFEETGTFKNSSKNWSVDFSKKILGGTLTVQVKAGEELFKRSIYIKAKNPSKEKLESFVTTLDGANGFEKILQHEALGKNFINADGEPIVAHDKGYGITQLTNPAPTYEQTWSWKENVKGGTKLYKEKRAAAKLDLEKKGKASYTEEQLQMETYTRYNGGKYHEWDETEKKWVRKKNILCDTATGNIGWSTSESINKDEKEKDLRERDKDTYKLGKAGQTAEHKWTYTGVCYADHVKNL